jgi:HSP20 family protein
MNAISRWTPYRGLNSLQEQVNRLFDDSFGSHRTGQSDLATWAPAVDVFETENELVVKAELPDMNEKDIDVRVENNTLTVRGERKFEQQATEDNSAHRAGLRQLRAQLFAPQYGQSRGDSRRIP